MHNEKEWKENVGDATRIISTILGRNWESDKTGLVDEIIRRKQYDTLQGVLETMGKMFALLSKAELMITTPDRNESALSDSFIMDVTRKLDQIDLSHMQTREKLDDIKAVLDDNAKLPDKESTTSYSGSMSGETDNMETESVKVKLDKRHNVMVFLPGNFVEPTYHKEVENVLTYLGCQKESILDTEIVCDRSDDPNQKIVLRVRMNSVEQASKAHANAYKLKNYSGPNIFIAKDMSFHHRMKLRELVNDLRHKILMLPEYRWKIVDWKVVKTGEFKRRTNRTFSVGDYSGHWSD